jgi:Ni/Co efflux regulator RcnB
MGGRSSNSFLWSVVLIKTAPASVVVAATAIVAVVVRVGVVAWVEVVVATFAGASTQLHQQNRRRQELFQQVHRKAGQQQQSNQEDDHHRHQQGQEVHQEPSGAATMEENLKRQQLFGLPSRYRDSVRAIRPLFLYNYSTHQLHGIFEAASFGGSNIDPTAWEDNKVPRRVQIPSTGIQHFIVISSVILLENPIHISNTYN